MDPRGVKRPAPVTDSEEEEESEEEESEEEEREDGKGEKKNEERKKVCFECVWTTTRGKCGWKPVKKCS